MFLWLKESMVDLVEKTIVGCEGNVSLAWEASLGRETHLSTQGIEKDLTVAVRCASMEGLGVCSHAWQGCSTHPFVAADTGITIFNTPTSESQRPVRVVSKAAGHASEDCLSA